MIERNEYTKIMLFNSIPFLFLFLPLSLIVFFFIGKKSGKLAKAILALLSFAFYAYWDFRYLPLLFISICMNFYIGCLIANIVNGGNANVARHYLVGGIAINLFLLGFFKYANLLTSTAHTLFDFSFILPHIVLPIGISFFTFTQIAFLVDTYQGKAKETNFWDYALFVSYFPHQIAGPILHHKEMMSQFRTFDRTSWNAKLFAVGLSVLAFGLAKKVLLADNLADIASPVFSSAELDNPIEFFEAWAGALAYALQLYFDFSAYCDMAIGISLMFGIRLPINFNSPYKSTSIIDFWKRWHITLSRFLREYLYIPLGGNRNGKLRRYLNLLTTMALGGLWHGASWTFLVWGMLHGIYLAINHLWREHAPFKPSGAMAIGWRIACWAMTFMSVLLAWIFFRANTFHGALNMLSVMSGSHGISLPEGAHRLAQFLPGISFNGHWLGSVNGATACAYITLMLLACLTMPNIQEIFSAYQPGLQEQSAAETRVKYPIERKFTWKPTATWAIPLAIILGVAISRLGNDSQFLYFNF